MKNIHVIPTSSPSKIFYIAENFHLEKGQLIEPKSYHNVYITSDEKTLASKGDWYLGHPLYTSIHRWHTDVSKIDGKNVFVNKIILTTDQELISDGVQAIDDEFLEWFVKNPSCEKVEVQKRYSDFTVEPFIGYKIIITQEEPKQEKWDKLNKELDDALEEAFGTSPSNILDVFENAKLVLREHLIANKEEVVKDLEQMREWSNTNKQETLEEAAIKYATNHGMMAYVFPEKRESFIDGAKWQAERMYSEEETIQLLIKFNQEIQEVENVKDWFEQFKKK
jgi:hypothetical protein